MNVLTQPSEDGTLKKEKARFLSESPAFNRFTNRTFLQWGPYSPPLELT